MSYRIRVKMRGTTTPLFRFLSPLFSVAFAIAVVGLILLAADVNPIAAYRDVVNEALGSLYGVSETLVQATPLILAGLGVMIAFRMQLWNIGAEGQLYMGAFAASGVALFSGIESHAVMMVTMFLAAALAGGLWGAIPGLLRARWGVNEVIVTLLMNYIAISWVEFLVYGPWKDPKGFNFPLTAQFANVARFTEYFDTRLHSGFILAVILVIVLYLFTEKTIWGYEIRVIGNNPGAARYAGMNIEAKIVLVMFLSGALAAIAGFSEVAGVTFRLQPSLSPGYGYTAIIVAWLARRSALGVLVVSLVFGVIYVGGDALKILWQLPVAFINVFQGLLLFFLLASDFFLTRKIELVKTPLTGDEQ